jgi:hypothetical protein
MMIISPSKLVCVPVGLISRSQRDLTYSCGVAMCSAHVRSCWPAPGQPPVMLLLLGCVGACDSAGGASRGAANNLRIRSCQGWGVQWAVAPDR